MQFTACTMVTWQPYEQFSQTIQVCNKWHSTFFVENQIKYDFYPPVPQTGGKFHLGITEALLS